MSCICQLAKISGKCHSWSASRLSLAWSLLSPLALLLLLVLVIESDRLASSVNRFPSLLLFNSSILYRIWYRSLISFPVRESLVNGINCPFNRSSRSSVSVSVASVYRCLSVNMSYFPCLLCRNSPLQLYARSSFLALGCRQILWCGGRNKLGVGELIERRIKGKGLSY